MDSRIQNLVELTKNKFHLNSYYLKRYSLDRDVNIYKETKYNLTMEWFPNDTIVSQDEEINIEGRALITIDIEDERFIKIIFVGGKSLVNNYLFDQSSKNEIIDWIEKETGFIYKSDFILREESDGQFVFDACVDGVKSFPEGLIKLEHDYLGRLILFSVTGEFPREAFVIKTKDDFTLEEVQHIANDQLKLIDIQSESKERQIPVYGIEEIFIKKAGLLTIPFNIFNSPRKHYTINELIYFEKPIKTKFKRVDIELSEAISLDQVYEKEKSPDAFPISSLQKTEIINAVKDFLRQVYSKDSGKWLLDTLNRNNGYINAVLKEKETKHNVFERKITLFINRENLQVINYLDNEPILKLLNQHTERNEVILSPKLAFEVIYDYIKFEPYYVFDFEKNKFIFSKKLSCDYAVNANNGKVTLINEVE